MAATSAKDDIEQRHLGLPPHLLSTSLLPWDGIADVTAALQLSPGETLLDLACGRGGYGMEIAARIGAELLRRVLVPGGRVVLTNWEPIEPGLERLPARLHTVDLGAAVVPS